MSFGITPLDFGINAHTLIHNAEFAAQASPTIFDIDPDTGSEGKITTVTWNGTSYIPKFADGSQGNAGTYNAQETANWLRTVLGKTKGHGVKFASLSPDDKALNEIEEEEETEDDSNGDNGDSNENGSSDDTEETEDDNLMLYGGIGIAVLAVILLMK